MNAVDKPCFEDNSTNSKIYKYSSNEVSSNDINESIEDFPEESNAGFDQEEDWNEMYKRMKAKQKVVYSTVPQNFGNNVTNS